MRIILVSILLLLNACGLIRDRSTEYASADLGKPLTVPESFSDLKISSRYPIPPIDNKRNLDEDYELPKPPNATAALDTQPYLIETVDGQTWLRLYTSPGRIWPLLDFFWDDYGLDIEFEDISKGYSVTKPFLPSAGAKRDLLVDLGVSVEGREELENSKIQAKLDQGIRRSTAELQVRVVDANFSSEKWQKGAPVTSVERSLLALIGGFLTSDVTRNRHSLLANGIEGESRVKLLKDGSGESYLSLSTSYQRAWNEIEKALESAEVLVSDIDVSERKFFISYLSNDEVVSWYRSEESAEQKSQERNFSLVLKQGLDGSIEVRVEQLNEDHDIQTGNELLNLVFEHIS